MPGTELKLDSSLEVSAGRQIIDQIRSKVTAGAWQPGQRLPSLQRMATQLGVALGTVDRAVRELAHEGLLEIKPRTGVFVRGELKISWEPYSQRVPVKEREREGLRQRFLRATPECSLTECSIAEAGAPYLPLDLVPTYFDELEDIGDLVLRLYGRTEPESGKVFDCLRWQGKLKLLTACWNVPVAFLNVELFEREGIPLPGADWDWGQLLDLAKRLAQPERGEYGYAVEYNRAGEHFLSLVRQNGGQVFNAAGTECKLAEAESIEAAELLRALCKYSPFAEKRGTSLSDDAIHLFASGSVAILGGDCWIHTGLKRMACFRFVVRPLPRGRFSATAFTADGFCMRRDGRARVLAETWLQLVADMERWPDHIDWAPGIPLHANLEEAGENTAMYRQALGCGRTYLSDMRADLRTVRHLETSRLIDPAVDRLLTEETPTTRILANLRDQIRAMLGVDERSPRRVSVSV